MHETAAQLSKKLYLCVRWGHAESAEGADGEDTNFVVRADSHEEAAELADAILGWMPTQVEGNTKLVEPHCHRVLELGTDYANQQESAVIVGPAMGHALRSNLEERYPSWCRGEVPGEFAWRSVREVFGEQG